MSDFIQKEKEWLEYICINSKENGDSCKPELGTPKSTKKITGNLEGKAYYGYKPRRYNPKNSEGNRFITNDEL